MGGPLSDSGDEVDVPDANTARDGFVPRSPWWTIPVVVAVAAVLVVAAWFSPAWFNPHLDQYSSGGAQTIPGTAFVLTETAITTRTPVTIAGVTGIPGAEPVLSWVTHTTGQTNAAQAAWDGVAALSCSADGRICGASAATASPVDPAALQDDLQAKGWSVPSNALPQQARSGDQLWVVWQISACPADDSAGAPQPLSAIQVGVRFRTLFGFTVTQYGTMIVSPFTSGTGWLQDMGVCPV
ncbi:MAG: hypothetical protein FWF25_06465 [Propionibacteriaceae bacterium]|nr:hypothetical protein [Propionibacteriaceae bacterium]